MRGRVIHGYSEILIRVILIEWKVGIRVVYLKFDVIGFGWGFWLSCSIELSGTKESHPHALRELDVTVSRHPAPIVQP